MSDERLIEEFLKEGNVFAVVGASRNPDKYGHKVYRDLREAGYKVYPINPNADEVLGDRCYPTLKKLPETPDAVDIVVPPKVTEKVVRECKKLGVDKVWMQPGSESEEALSYCKENGIETLSEICVVRNLSNFDK